jgi:hypothetical protein
MASCEGTLEHDPNKGREIPAFSYAELIILIPNYAAIDLENREARSGKEYDISVKGRANKVKEKHERLDIPLEDNQTSESLRE